jgi:hypothetical protein
VRLHHGVGGLDAGVAELTDRQSHRDRNHQRLSPMFHNARS